MQITTERLSIRRVAEADWQAIREIWVDFTVSSYAQYDMPHNTDPADVQAHITRWAAFSDSTEHMFFAICLEERLIGYVVFHIREDGYETGYCFHSSYHGKGYAKESLLALMEHVREMGITKLSAGTALNNLPSVGLLKSVGFHLAETEKVSFYKDAEGNDIVFDGGIFKLQMETAR